MTIALRSRHSSSFTNRPLTSGFMVVGDLPVSYFDDLTFDDIVVGSSGKTLGELTFEDVLRIDVFTLRTKHSSSFSYSSKHA